MLIEHTRLEHWIDHFYGYGSWEARFWFIGYEESGGEIPEEVADKVNYFFKAHRAGQGKLCDIRDLYRHVRISWDGPKANLFTNRYEYRFDGNAVQNNVWKNLISFVHGYSDENVPDFLTYQRNTFVSSSAKNEALIQLYPLPSPHNHAWYYSWLDLPQLPFLKSRELYQEHVYRRRMDTILSNIKMYKPEVVLMYGMNNINALKQTVQKFFGDAKFTMIKR